MSKLDPKYRNCVVCDTPLEGREVRIYSGVKLLEVFCSECGNHTPLFLDLRSAFIYYYDHFKPAKGL